MSINSLTNVQVGERLYEERKRLGLTQTGMGDAAGISMFTYRKYEAGERSPDAECLANLYLAGVDVLYIVTGTRNNSELDNAETAMLELFRKAEPKMKKALLTMLQTYNTQG